MSAPLVPPGPKVLFPIRLVSNFRSAPLAFVRQMTSTYGDNVYFKAAGRGIYLFNDPESVQQVLVTRQNSFHKGHALQRLRNIMGDGLVTSEDELHLRQRRMIQPMFHRQRIAGYADTMVSLAEDVTSGWQDGAMLDIHTEISHLTLSIVAKTLFDTDVASEARELGDVISTLVTSYTYTIGPLGKLHMLLPLSYTKRIRAAGARLDGAVQTMIAERRTEGDRGDLLSMLIAAQDDEDENSRMSDTQVRDEVLTLFLAGNETTATALTWTFYLLSQNPEAAQQLYAELKQVLNGRNPTYMDVESLPYTRMILSESMRLYPPAWIMTRTPIEDVEISGYSVPKGSSVALCQWVVHHNERYYPESMKFDPGRWTPENVAARPKMAYFPFGGGARMCMGEPFAWMEGILLLATIAQKWEMSLEPGFPVELLPEITLRPKHGMRMQLKKRL